jgi:transcriptional regulator with XRE-family HTH domain
VWVEAEHYKVVGAYLAAARRQANVTQQVLARKLSKPQSFVSEYERGKRRIDVIEFLKITQTIGANPIYVLSQIARSTFDS